MSSYVTSVENGIRTEFMAFAGVALLTIFVAPMILPYMDSLPVVGTLSPMTKIGILAGASAGVVNLGLNSYNGPASST